MSATTLSSVPVTCERPAPELRLPNPGRPRVSIAADETHPNGSIEDKRKNMTVLQLHTEFFDRDKDGIIFPWETFEGFRAVGFNPILSAFAVPVIHSGFAFASQDSWIPSLLFPIYLKNIHKTKHGSDSETYDTEGRFVPEKFEEIFSKYDEGSKGALTFWEMWNMTKGNRNVLDPFGWWAAIFEWGSTWLLCQENGTVSKEYLRRIFDGTLFYQLEESIRRQKKLA